MKWRITSRASDKNLDGTLRIGSLRRSNNNEQISQKENSMEHSRLDPQHSQRIRSVQTEIGKSKNLQDRILKTFNKSRLFAWTISNQRTRYNGSLKTVCIKHRKRYAVYVRKAAQHKQKPSQLAQNISRIHTQKPQNVRKSCTQTYAKSIYVRKICTKTYAKDVKHTQSRIHL